MIYCIDSVYAFCQGILGQYKKKIELFYTVSYVVRGLDDNR